MNNSPGDLTSRAPLPTPKLTAKRAAAQILLVKIFGTEDYTDQVKDVIDAVIASATRQAFEEAAEIDATASVMTSRDYYRGWKDAMNYYRDAILALAKEQGGG